MTDTTMKKTYIIPLTQAMHLQTEQQMLASSTDVGNQDYGFTYGGVDTDGSITPEVKGSGWNIWNDDWSKE